MYSKKLRGNNVSILGYGLMRLPRDSEKGFEIDFEASEKLIDHAMANGINYFDMAHTYNGSEEFAGRALSKYPRESYHLATKCPPWKLKTGEDFEAVFNGELEKCKTDYFDYYLVHNFAEEAKRADNNEESFEHFEKIGMYDILQKKKAEGKVRNVGFSFHGTPELLEKLVAKYEWDFAQIQLNYIDYTATDAARQYQILAERNIPIVIMEPLRGGALATLNEEAVAALHEANPDASAASWGLRYAASFPQVMCVLSGMNEQAQLDDNLKTMSDFVPLTEAENELMYKVAAIYNKSGAVPCTGCRYCMPCPMGVDIPRIFSIYNYYKNLGFRIPFDNGYASLTAKEKASSCVDCGKCEKECPQHIKIPELMREINDFAQAAQG